MESKVHEGRNIKRFRELLGIKQDALAVRLGEGWNQQKISLLEQRESIELPLLRQISSAMRVPVEVLQNFDEEQVVNIFSNTFDSCSQPASFFYNSTLNPLEQIVKLHEEKIALYERMLEEKEQMIDRLEKLLKEK